eukprot:TRINITY_DN1448_c0_g2_i1.p1 TRINITY_DN1448_c0_g2~~TRINITY_DN1448_c0_g2_i1.p1  ORF type:complete len:890 (+),score=246.45 TRINITY_DN1448_c0_g2_i1:139-2808(+)
MSFKKIKDNFFFVGVFDPNLRVFDIVMQTEFGTSYNAFLLQGREKNVLFETVKLKDGMHFYEDFVKNIEAVIGKEGRIDYIVHNHTEPDHSGSARRLMEEKYPDATVIGTPQAIEFLEEIGNRKFKHIVAEDKMTIDIGGFTLEFHIAPFLHWPDSMFTYIKELKSIVTCDFFGAHFSDERVFSDLIDTDYSGAFKYYYDCIFGPYPKYVQDGLKIMHALEIDTICCSHGPVLRGDLEPFFEKYREWSKIPVKKDIVVIAYVSAYGYTEEMAKTIAEGIRSAGVEVELFDLVTDPTGLASVIEAVSTRAKGLLLGTPTIVSDALPPIMSIATSLNPVIHGDLVAGVFGSYGWGGEGPINVDQRLQQLRVKLPFDPFRIRFRASEEDLKKCLEYGEKFARCVLGETIDERTKDEARSKKKKVGGIDVEKLRAEGKTRLWKCIVCGETFWGVTPPELCPACGAGWEQFVEVVVHDDQEIEKVEYDGHILVIGAGAAAISAVNTIRKYCVTCKITVVTDENEYPYYRPSVSDGISNLSVFEKPEFLLHPPEWYEENNVRLLLGKRAEELDTQAKTAHILNAETMVFEEEIKFDRLIMAVGSRCWCPMKDFVGAYSNVFSIRVPSEVRRIREYMDKHSVKKICFVGAGILALEAASEMTELKAEVHMVELADRVLPMQIDEDGSKVIRGVLDKKNVHLHLSTVVADIHASEGRVTSLTLKNGDEVAADMIIVAVGVRSNLELLLASQNVKCARAIQVDDHMATSAPDVFACGDCCEWNGKFMASWPSAQAQGEVAGANAIGLSNHVFKGVSFPYFMDAFGAKIFSVGNVNPKEDLPMIRLMDPAKKEYKKIVFTADGKASGAILMGDTSLAVSMEEAVNEGWTMKEVIEVLSE